MKKTDKGTHIVVFQPTFGNRPDQYIGRDGVIEQFMMGLQEPVGSATVVRCSSDKEVWARRLCFWN